MESINWQLSLICRFYLLLINAGRKKKFFFGILLSEKLFIDENFWNIYFKIDNSFFWEKKVY